MLLQVMNQNVTSTYISTRTKISRQCQIVRCYYTLFYYKFLQGI